VADSAKKPKEDKEPKKGPKEEKDPQESNVGAAVPTEPVAQLKPGEADPLIQKAVETLRMLVERVQTKRKAESLEADAAAMAAAQSTGLDAIAVPDFKGEDVYVSIDGDGIGNAVMRAESKDDEQTLSDISRKIEHGQGLFRDWVLAHSGRIIEAGGDEALARVSSVALPELEAFRATYHEGVGATLTIGVGRKISESTKARSLGKLRGKNQICYFEEGSTDEELQARIEAAGPETPEKKLVDSLAEEGQNQGPKKDQDTGAALEDKVDSNGKRVQDEDEDRGGVGAAQAPSDKAAEEDLQPERDEENPASAELEPKAKDGEEIPQDADQAPAEFSQQGQTGDVPQPGGVTPQYTKTPKFGHPADHAQDQGWVHEEGEDSNSEPYDWSDLDFEEAAPEVLQGIGQILGQKMRESDQKAAAAKESDERRRSANGVGT
jgi:hypothetical protein